MGKAPAWPVLYGSLVLFFVILALLISAWFIRVPDVIVLNEIKIESSPISFTFKPEQNFFPEKIFVINHQEVSVNDSLVLLRNTKTGHQSVVLSPIDGTVLLNPWSEEDHTGSPGKLLTVIPAQIDSVFGTTSIEAKSASEVRPGNRVMIGLRESGNYSNPITEALVAETIPFQGEGGKTILHIKFNPDTKQSGYNPLIPGSIVSGKLICGNKRFIEKVFPVFFR